MDSLQIDKAHIVGLSMGGFVAGDMVALHPERMIGDWTAWQPLHYEPRLIYGRDAIRVLQQTCPDVPSLIILGGVDVQNGRSTHPDMLDYLPNGRCEVLPDCGHMCNIEQPEAFNTMVLGFISEVDGQLVVSSRPEDSGRRLQAD